MIQGPFSVSTNHADDILGTPDTRPGTWGLAGYNVHTITFHPPAGYRVRILRVYGNFQGWLRENPSGKAVGVLWGLQTTAKEGSDRVSPAADNTMLYVQDATNGQPFRVPVDYNVGTGGLLEADNILYSKVAVFMNETGQAVHLEPSFTIQFNFEKAK
jgi:hypothetical protein